MENTQESKQNASLRDLSSLEKNIISSFSVEDVQDKFACDLVEMAKLHVQFLKTAHVLGYSISRPKKESIRRYDELWLPLMANLNKMNLQSDGGKEPIEFVPPGDIAWIWHCHRLAPYQYTKYVQRRFGLSPGDMLNAYPPFSLQVDNEEGNERSQVRDLWYEHYPDEPFFLKEEETGKVDTDDKTSYDSKKVLDGFDIFGSCERQASFLWQVSGERFNDDEFLLEGVRNYYKFLTLKKSDAGSKQIIVPTYQIDLMWHTHMLSSMKDYNNDCCNIIGKTLNHDDSLNDRTEGGTLDTAFRKTKRIWVENFDSAYEVSGGMYRGEPPDAYFSRDWVKCTDNINIPPSTRFLHLVGKVGASSTGVPDTGDIKWLDPTKGETCTIENKQIPSFISAREKSAQRGQNNNPKLQDYVFGEGCKSNTS